MIIITQEEVKSFTQRMPDDLYQQVKQLAAQKGTSVNGIINQVMQEYAGTELTPNIISEFRKRIEALEKEVFKK